MENNINKQDLRIPKFYNGTCPFKNSYNIHINCIRRHFVVVPCDCDIYVSQVRNLAYGIEYSPKKKKKKKKLKEKEAHYGASVFYTILCYVHLHTNHIICMTFTIIN